MSQLGSDETLSTDRPAQAHAFADTVVAERDKPIEVIAFADLPTSARRTRVPRRTPRMSLIVVLPEHHVVCPDQLAERLRGHEDQEIDIVVACAGQPTNLSALQRSVGEAQFLLAPAGTSVEDLRELAMRQVPGDIVTLLSGGLVQEDSGTAEMFMSS